MAVEKFCPWLKSHFPFISPANMYFFCLGQNFLSGQKLFFPGQKIFCQGRWMGYKTEWQLQSLFRKFFCKKLHILEFKTFIWCLSYIFYKFFSANLISSSFKGYLQWQQTLDRLLGCRLFVKIVQCTIQTQSRRLQIKLQ